jgi:eukaryotic-like serine/threonine-protein kinase
VDPAGARLADALRDRYQVEQQLGQGGMAMVYRARDLRHERPVAIKLMRPELASTLGPERFLREIRVTAGFDHPYILPVLDSGGANGLLWYAMPWVEGESLRDRLLLGGQLPLEEAIRLAREVADALDCAHRRGVVHRDIKPENILLSGGHARVADFGVARALEVASVGQLTETGLALGTPAYMSPEQASGGQVDGRSDIYALGCVLYEMVAGEAPFTGPTAQALIARHLTEAPRPLHLCRATVPPALEHVVEKALAKSPADRFATAAEFGEALAGVERTGATIPSRAAITARAPRRRRIPTSVLTLVLGILIGLGALVGWLRSHRGEGTGEAEGKVVAVLPFENQGSAQDEYFSDGLTDAVRGKLAGLSTIQVIARASSTPYKKTAKTPEEIARELGARYLLTGTVQWERSGAGNRIRVSPELVEVPAAGRPKTRWQQPFDASLTDVFEVQAQIASQVAQALDLALGASERQRLESKPTSDSAAYDAYVRANLLFDRGVSQPDMQAQLALYEKAVALDSSFALAWAALSRVHDAIYWFYQDRTPARIELARQAAERAIRLQPDLAEGHVALGFYYYHKSLDYERALGELERARQLQPSNSDVYSSMGAVHRRQGKWSEVMADMQKAAALNPRSTAVLTELGITQAWIRAYPEAERTFERVLRDAPTEARAQWVFSLISTLRDGDTLATQQRLGRGLAAAGAERLLPQLWDYTGFYTSSGAHTFAFDPSLAGLPLSVFGTDTIGYYSFKGTLQQQLGHPAMARPLLDSARTILEHKLVELPAEPRLHAVLGRIDAELGRQAEARREAERAVELLPISRDALDGVLYRANLARVLARIGQPEAALEHLIYLLSIPGPLSAASLRVDPLWAPLRNDPRFQRLLERR